MKKFSFLASSIFATFIFVLSGFMAYGAEFKTVKDHMGYTVKIPLNPKRILALNPSIMEGLYELGMKPVGKVEEYKIRPEGKNLPSVGSQTNVNIESIYKLKPDLIIANIRNHGSIVNSLKETGAVVYMYDPAKLGEQPFYDIPIFLGELFNKKSNAKEYVENLNAISSKYKSQIEKSKKIKTGIVVENIEDLSVYQKATGYGTILDSLGIKNIVPDNMPGANKDNAVKISIEKIYENNPDLILILAPINNTEANNKLLEKIKNDAKWKNLKAVKSNNIKIMPFNLHPGRAKKEELIKMMAETILSN